MTARARISARLWVLLALATVLVLVPAVASAQQPPPPGGSTPVSPPGGQGAGGGGGPGPDSPEIIDAAERTAVALAQELALLDLLGALTDPVPAELQAVFDEYGLVTVPAGDRAALLTALDAADEEAASQAAVLTGNGVVIAPDREPATDLLDQADRASLDTGGTISVTVETYVVALEDLVSRNGRPPLEGSETDPAVVATALATVLDNQADEAVTPSSDDLPPDSGPADLSGEEDAGEEDSSSDLPLYLGLGLLASAVAVIAVVLVLRRSPSGGEARSESEQPDFDGLLDVNRRLASAMDEDEVERIAVGEAVRLAEASAGALVHVEDGGFSVAYESSPDVLVPDRLGEGILERVASTAEKMHQVSRTEPAIRNLPAAVAAVPIVAAGTVRRVLIVLRSETRPFDPPTVDRLAAVGPNIGAALENARARSAAEEASLVDGLTGVGNRRRFEAELRHLLADESGEPTGLVMVDLDHFKQVNDQHGHPAGDRVLQAMGTLLQADLRPRDAVYRYGGEEFCVVLPGSDRDEAAAIAERLRATIAADPVSISGDGAIDVTASLGVAAAVGGPPEDLVRSADRALYEAKQGGRNRVVTAS